MLPRTVCKREITRDEALHYLREGKTELLTDFTSRFGRPFSATLVLKENGRHGFEFPPRKPRGAEAAPAAEGAATADAAAGADATPARPRGRAPRKTKSGAATPARVAAKAPAKPRTRKTTARAKSPRKTRAARTPATE